MTDAILERARELLSNHDTTWLKLRAGEIKPLCTALVAADERIAKLTAALRRHAIDGRLCKECRGYWPELDGPERHAPGCLAAADADE